MLAVELGSVFPYAAGSAYMQSAGGSGLQNIQLHLQKVVEAKQCIADQCVARRRVQRGHFMELCR